MTCKANPVFVLGPSDAAEVAALEYQCFSTPWSVEQFTQAFEQETFFLWGMRNTAGEYGVPDFEEGAILAYLAVYCVAGELEILNIAVHPKARRRGLGRTLLGTVLQNVSKTGISRALLEVRRTNTPAIGLYEALGFVAVGMRPHYYQDTNEDAIIYGRDLV